MELNVDIFSILDKKWALLTAGTKDHFNSMTISWGGMGTIWGKPVVTTYVRTSRYTHEFMDDNEYFTLSFYPDEKKSILGVFGSKSGRDIDKMNYEGLTLKEAGNSITFEEAEITLVCKKLFKQRLDEANMPKDIVDSFYKEDAPHDMYIGEVVDIIKK
ncbi:MAG: flavin reductase [Eubacterium sp.]|nr:flavin reductase [Eubacterium sp.]